jgi:hypothetical protein
MEDKSKDNPYRRQIEEAERIIREDWPDWMRRNRDAVHVPVQNPKTDPIRSKPRQDS